MSPDDPRHGTEAGYEQHARDGEDSCGACYQAKLVAGRRRNKRKTMGHRYTVSSDATRTRIETWRKGGASYGDIARHTGLAESRIWEIANDGSPIIYTRTQVAVLTAHGWPVTPKGITRRVRALCRLGWTIPRIAAACGVHHDTILDIRRRQPEFVAVRVGVGILEGYDALSGRLPEPRTPQERAGVTRARNYAAQQHWQAPLAWDDIDDPNEQPTRATTRINSHEDVDPVVIERILAGESLKVTIAERKAVIAAWVASGRPKSELNRITGWALDRVKTTKDEEAA